MKTVEMSVRIRGRCVGSKAILLAWRMERERFTYAKTMQVYLYGKACQSQLSLGEQTPRPVSLQRALHRIPLRRSSRSRSETSSGLCRLPPDASPSLRIVANTFLLEFPPGLVRQLRKLVSLILTLRKALHYSLARLHQHHQV